MIVPTMRFYEMYEELATDLPKIEYKHQQLMPKAVKKFRKTKSFPVWNFLNTQILLGAIHTSYFFMRQIDKLLKILNLIISLL